MLYVDSEKKLLQLVEISVNSLIRGDDGAIPHPCFVLQFIAITILIAMPVGLSAYLAHFYNSYPLLAFLYSMCLMTA